jgi:hypothetical protein
MGRKTEAEREGLDVSITEEEGGTFLMTLTDDSGTVLYSRGGYKSVETAKHGSYGYIRKHIRPASMKVNSTKPPPITSASGNQLVNVLRRKARDHDREVVRLRQQADLLEGEAKRLDAAADILEGPEAHG